MWQLFTKLVPVLLAASSTTTRTTTTTNRINTTPDTATPPQAAAVVEETKTSPTEASSATTADTASRWPPQNAQDLTHNFKNVYKEHPGPIYRQNSTLRLSYVSPPVNGTSTWRIDQQLEDGVFDEDHQPDPDKPIALYLPGLDGYGLSAFNHQFDDMASAFQLWRLHVQPEDRSSFMEVVRTVAHFIEDHVETNNNKDVIIIGESCGGLFAAATALYMLRRKESKDILKGLVLVNPATSFDETIWDRAVPILSSLKYLDDDKNEDDDRLTPYSVIGSLILSAIIPDGDQLRRIMEAIVNLPDVDIPPSNMDQLDDVTKAMFEAFRETEFRLPPDVLEHRVNWLTSSAHIVNSRLHTLDIPTLVIAGAEDKLLPSTKEAERLLETLPMSETLKVPGRGHFVLDETVNLTEAILYSKIDPLGWDKTKKKYDPVLDWTPPPKQVQDEVIEKSVKPFRTAVSPVFFSTDSNGKRWKGLAKVPRPEEPLLIVANHQFAALDLRILAAELIEQRGIWPRGLAHPVTFITTKDLPGELSGRTPGLLVNRNPFNGEFQQFGAVEVSPRNYYKMLQAGFDALLFPGGAKEALTAGKDYPLYWPEKIDFVRTAARFNATVLPLSAVGMLDSVNVLAEPQQLANIPFIRDRAFGPQNNISAARYDQSSEDEVLGFPLALPSLPARNYFIFGKPISLKNVDPMDREACGRAYQEAQDEVRRGLDDLLRAREHDPFKSSIRRLAYERIFGKEAPTFPVDELNS